MDVTADDLAALRSYKIVTSQANLTKSTSQPAKLRVV